MKSNVSPAMTAGSSDVAAVYRASFGKAWQKTSEGSSPTTAYSGTVGTAVGLLSTKAPGGQERADALAALDACYVRAMAHFVDATLSIENLGTTQCIDALQAPAVHRGALRGFLTDVGEDAAAYDQRLNAQIVTKVGSVCPDAAATILTSYLSLMTRPQFIPYA